MDNKIFLGEGEHYPIYGWTKHVGIDDAALEKLKKMASLAFVHEHIACMPDVHMGRDAVVGAVLATKGAIIPSVVGCDIGCGMLALKTNLKADRLPDDLRAIRSDIEAAVPHGNGAGAVFADPSELGADRFKAELRMPLTGVVNKTRGAFAPSAAKAACQLGTLGAGNHFIEMSLDEHNDVWLVFHSGSRGIGAAIGGYFITRARELAEEFALNLPDKDLAFFPEGVKEYDDYVAAVEWAQEFARINREVMAAHVLSALSRHFPDIEISEMAIDCHHNYVAMEKHFDENVWVARKGAVRARKDDLGIIPGSMGARSFIVRGLGNADSFHSCSHGAGRIMSREEARDAINKEEHAAAVKGVECRIDDEILEESPKAYKNIDDVMRSQSDLVEVLFTLKQVLCVKG
ncbi:MAG: RtcB family protein [Rickettsiales bacterium]